MKTNKFDTNRFCVEHSITDDLFRYNDGMPVKYIFILTNLCNLDCSFCFMEHINVVDAMTAENWLLVLEQLPDYATVILMGGEPMYFREFEQVFIAASNRFRTSIVTNGTLLSEKLLDLLLNAPNFHDLGVSIDDIGGKNRNMNPNQWEGLVNGCKYFVTKRTSSRKPILSVKTVILDENASTLFELHKFTHEELGCNSNTYGTLCGTAMQNSDKMQDFKELDKAPPTPYIYKNWSIIREQLEMIREYNQKNGYKSYLRPKVIDLNSDEPMSNIDMLNQPDFDRDTFATCKVPWADLRIFPDGNVTTCLSVSLGNVKNDTVESIVKGKLMKEIRDKIRLEKFTNQCIRCNYTYSKHYE